MSRKVSSLWISSVVLFFLLWIFILGVIISAISLIIIRFSSTSEEEPQFNEYQVLSFNPTTKHTSVGMLNLQRSLGDDEFISYKNRRGNHFLISNFGEGEFQCTGKCYCDTEKEDSFGNKRRVTSASNVLTRSLIYLVSAVSATVALQKATEYFKEECVKRLTSDGSCSVQDSIFSEEDECVNLIDIKGNTNRENPFDYEEYVTRGNPDRRNRFQCHGHCRYRTTWFPMNMGEPKSEEEEEMNHEMLESIKILSFTGGCGKYKIDMTFKLDTYDLEMAKLFFIKEHLHPFCVDVSEEEWVHAISGNVYTEPICLGALTFWQNPTVECRIWNFD